MSTSITIASVSMAVLGTLLYHVFQKEIPADANPALALVVMYATGVVLSLGLLVWFRPTAGLATGLGQLNWASVSVAAAVIFIEMGTLLMYRHGWDLSIGSLVVNVAAALLLVGVGYLVYGERLSAVNAAGVVASLVGLALINWKPG